MNEEPLHRANEGMHRFHLQWGRASFMEGEAACPCNRERAYRGTSLTRKHPPPRTTLGPWAQGDCRDLGGGGFL